MPERSTTTRRGNVIKSLQKSNCSNIKILWFYKCVGVGLFPQFFQYFWAIVMWQAPGFMVLQKSRNLCVLTIWGAWESRKECEHGKRSNTDYNTMFRQQIWWARYFKRKLSLPPLNIRSLVNYIPNQHICQWRSS